MQSGNCNWIKNFLLLLYSIDSSKAKVGEFHFSTRIHYSLHALAFLLKINSLSRELSSPSVFDSQFAFTCQVGVIVHRTPTVILEREWKWDRSCCWKFFEQNRARAWKSVSVCWLFVECGEFYYKKRNEKHENSCESFARFVYCASDSRGAISVVRLRVVRFGWLFTFKAADELKTFLGETPDGKSEANRKCTENLGECMSWCNPMIRKLSNDCPDGTHCCVLVVWETEFLQDCSTSLLAIKHVFSLISEIIVSQYFDAQDLFLFVQIFQFPDSSD